MTYLQRRDAFLKKINDKSKTEAPKVVEVLPSVALYSLIKIESGKRTVVGFGMTYPEAESLSEVLTRKMKRSTQFDDSGGALFEITLSEIKKEVRL